MGSEGSRERGEGLLIPDLQDMSPVTLNTNTPRDFFTKHRLLLHVSKSEMDKVRVFQASRELPSTLTRGPLPALAQPLLTPLQPIIPEPLFSSTF